MSIDVVRHLIGVPLFAGLSAEALTSLAGHTRILSFGVGETIVEMDTGTPLFVVLEGLVQVVDPAATDPAAHRVLGPGERFGDRSLLNGELSKTNIVASEDVQLLMLEQASFRKLVAQTPEVALQIIENLSTQMGRADELIRDLSDTAMRDALTGILNRRAYEERLGEEVDRSLRYSEKFSLILTDLDRFKSINDTYGHNTGDVVLHWVGRLLTDHTRSPDTPFRIGGEEFAILAPATNKEVAHHVAQRLVDVVGEARPPLDFDVDVTMSAGFACCPDHGASVSELFGLADQALLRAKAEGRNRVCGPTALEGTPKKEARPTRRADRA